MAADKRSFSHITVTDEEEDDLVIRAGAPSGDADGAGAAEAPGADAPREASGRDGAAEAPSCEAAAAREGLEAAGEPDGAGAVEGRDVEEDRSGSGKAAQSEGAARAEGAAGSGRAKEKRPETSLQDLESSKMGGMQKAIVAIAVLAIIGFAVYYMFFR